jgi:membrane protease YdiL (CAAX protease family)
MVNTEMKTKNRAKKAEEVSPVTFKTIFQQRDPESSLILFVVPILLTIWVYFGKQADFDQLFKGFQSRWNQDFYSTVYEYLTAFLLMFWVPYFIIKIGFKNKLKNFGFQLGDARYGFRFIFITLPFLIWIIYVGSSNAGIQTEYPLAKSTLGMLPLFFTVEMFYLLYYIGWEFLFRGFMLFGLEKQYGAFTAILIQTIPSAIVHIGKPASESFGAILAGLIFGFLAIRTRSILYPLLLHIVIGIGTDVFVMLRLG